MEREANYAAVGAFVLLVAVMAGLFVYWYAASREHRDYTRYEIYFDGSVSGLSEGGSVRYLGVDVGRVVRIRLDSAGRPRPGHRRHRLLHPGLRQHASRSSRSQGVTGLLYIDLRASPLSAGRRRARAAPCRASTIP